MCSEAEFEAVVAACYERLLWRAGRILRNREDAEDAVQSALLGAYRFLPKFRGDSSLETWLTRAVINKALESLRKHRAKRRVTTISLQEPVRHTAEGAAIYPDPETHKANPEQAAATAEFNHRVVVAMARLSPARRAVVCHVIAGDTLEETSAAMGLSLAATKSALTRARQRLVAKLPPAVRA